MFPFPRTNSDVPIEAVIGGGQLPRGGNEALADTMESYSLGWKCGRNGLCATCGIWSQLLSLRVDCLMDMCQRDPKNGGFPFGFPLKPLNNVEAEAPTTSPGLNKTPAVHSQAANLDLLRKQEAAERQLVEWKQEPPGCRLAASLGFVASAKPVGAAIPLVQSQRPRWLVFLFCLPIGRS